MDWLNNLLPLTANSSWNTTITSLWVLTAVWLVIKNARPYRFVQLWILIVFPIMIVLNNILWSTATNVFIEKKSRLSASAISLRSTDSSQKSYSLCFVCESQILTSVTFKTFIHLNTYTLFIRRVISGQEYLVFQFCTLIPNLCPCKNCHLCNKAGDFSMEVMEFCFLFHFGIWDRV